MSVPRRKTTLLLAVSLGLASLFVIVVVLIMASFEGSGARRGVQPGPEKTVRKFLDSIEKQDAVKALETLEPCDKEILDRTLYTVFYTNVTRVVLRDDLSDSRITRFKHYIESLPVVAGVMYVSTEQALREAPTATEYTNEEGEVVPINPQPPPPPEFYVCTKDSEHNESIMKTLQKRPEVATWDHSGKLIQRPACFLKNMRFEKTDLSTEVKGYSATVFVTWDTTVSYDDPNGGDWRTKGSYHFMSYGMFPTCFRLRRIGGKWCITGLDFGG